ncbi:MAG: DUF167 family protein [Gammaproteobacteria bacterium]|nr:DUF167 family protein [Gammaproteobacteria bacterium]
MAEAIHWSGTDLVLHIQAQPRAHRTEYAGRHGDTIKIRLNAPPVDGKANDVLIDFLAETFAVPKRQVTFLGGEGARTKRLRIERPTKLPDWAIPPKP